MRINWPRRTPFVLAVLGAVFALLAVMDKLFGLVQHPLHLATLAYASLFAMIAWAVTRGIPVRPSRLVRLSSYAAILILNVLTATYVFAWKVSADPTPLVLQRQLAAGDALLNDGQKLDALIEYRKAYRRFPDSYAVLMRMGAAAYQNDDFESAAKYYQRALELAPADSRWRTLNNLGQSYWKLRQPDEAVEYYRRAEEAGMPKSESVEWHYRLGWAYFDLKDYDAAIEHYRFVGTAGEKYAAASYYNIACALAQKIRATPDPALKRAMTHEAVESLRLAWQAISTPEEREELRKGLVGSAEELDPELAPLRSSAEFRTLLQEFRAG
jgi:tetratricopeptide (TPR) repeat protein